MDHSAATKNYVWDVAESSLASGNEERLPCLANHSTRVFKILQNGVNTVLPHWAHSVRQK